MKTRSFTTAAALGTLVLAFAAAPALTQNMMAPPKKADAPAAAPAAPKEAAKEAPKEYEPQRGQAGKDVVWVPTSEDLVEAMLDKAKLGKDDIHYDLGSGDGRTVIAAAKRGAQAFGVEYNPDMVELSKRNAEKAGVKNATFVRGDIFETDFSKATVITLFLLPDLNFRLRPTILNMKPGTRVVSNSFDMREWEADETITLGQAATCTSFCRAYYWVVPAKVEGKWQTPQGELTLNQTFQMLSGDLKGAAVKGKLLGSDITLTVGDTTWTGKVDGNKISLTSGGNKLEATKG